MQIHVPSLTCFPFNRSHFCLPEQAEAAYIMFNTTALLFFLVIQDSQNSALERRWIFYAPNETVLTWGMKRTQVYEEQPQQCNTVVFLYEFQQSKIGGIRGDHSDIFSNMKRSARGTSRPIVALAAGEGCSWSLCFIGVTQLLLHGWHGKK